MNNFNLTYVSKFCLITLVGSLFFANLGHAQYARHERLVNPVKYILKHLPTIAKYGSEEKLESIPARARRIINKSMIIDEEISDVIADQWRLEAGVIGRSVDSYAASLASYEKFYSNVFTLTSEEALASYSTRELFTLYVTIVGRSQLQATYRRSSVEVQARFHEIRSFIGSKAKLLRQQLNAQGIKI